MTISGFHHRHVAVVGLMGAGKTALGIDLASRLELPLRDSDRDIEASEGLSSRKIAERLGVKVLHDIEARQVDRALRGRVNSVVCPAASVFDRADCVELLRRTSFVVWLDIPTDVLAARLGTKGHRRELTHPAAELAALRTRRQPAFQRAADLIVTDPQLSVIEIADEVMSVFDETRT